MLFMYLPVLFSLSWSCRFYFSLLEKDILETPQYLTLEHFWSFLFGKLKNPYYKHVT